MELVTITMLLLELITIVYATNWELKTLDIATNLTLMVLEKEMLVQIFLKLALLQQCQLWHI